MEFHIIYIIKSWLFPGSLPPPTISKCKNQSSPTGYTKRCGFGPWPAVRQPFSRWLSNYKIVLNLEGLRCSGSVGGFQTPRHLDDWLLGLPVTLRTCLCMCSQVMSAKTHSHRNNFALFACLAARQNVWSSESTLHPHSSGSCTDTDKWCQHFCSKTNFSKFCGLSTFPGTADWILAHRFPVSMSDAHLFFLFLLVIFQSHSLYITETHWQRKAHWNHNRQRGGKSAYFIYSRVLAK